MGKTMIIIITVIICIRWQELNNWHPHIFKQNFLHANSFYSIKSYDGEEEEGDCHGQAVSSCRWAVDFIGEIGQYNHYLTTDTRRRPLIFCRLIDAHFISYGNHEDDDDVHDHRPSSWPHGWRMAAEEWGKKNNANDSPAKVSQCLSCTFKVCCLIWWSAGAVVNGQEWVGVRRKGHSDSKGPNFAFLLTSLLFEWWMVIRMLMNGSNISGNYRAAFLVLIECRWQLYCPLKVS